MQQLGTETQVLALAQAADGSMLAGTLPTGQIYRNGVALAYHVGFRVLDAVIQDGMPMPATGDAPRSLLFRVTDTLNYWEVRILPNTAGNDTFIVEHVAGVMTTRASADVDWTAGQTDEIQVTVSGTSIAVAHKKFGAGTWTNACSYATMGTGLSADKHGILIYQTAVNQFSYWSAEAL